MACSVIQAHAYVPHMKYLTDYLYYIYLEIYRMATCSGTEESNSREQSGSKFPLISP